MTDVAEIARSLTKAQREALDRANATILPYRLKLPCDCCLNGLAVRDYLKGQQDA